MAKRKYLQTIHQPLLDPLVRYLYVPVNPLLLISFGIFGLVIYYLFTSLSYFVVFDHEMKKHPKYLKKQVWMEIKQANAALPGMSFLTLPIILAEVRGYSTLYDTTVDGPGYWYDILQFPLFIIFADFCIYWIHRGLHHPRVYKTLHKPHHKWIVPTPYASYAFHPVDGFFQSIPYHLFPFLFPLQKIAYLGLLIFVNFWSILIHDGEYLANNPIVNGAACHTVHHLYFYFNFNCGQYTTLWDRLGNSYREPNEELFQKETMKSAVEWKNQSREMETKVSEIQGVDDRTYELLDVKKRK
jgi:lathosterol oxidase